jgi:ABC-2 type transport system permease protein
MVLFLLVFLSSAFVRARSMPEGLRQFAGYQPFSPMVDTTRGLLTGGGVGNQAVVAVAWSIGIAVVSYVWATRLYNGRRAADPS